MNIDEERADARALTHTAQLVLGMIATFGPMTSYQLERRVATTVGNFWMFPHSQLYAEPRKLVAGGLLDEQVEEGGRRRRVYRLTDEGEEAVRTWFGEPELGRSEARDPGLLKLFFADLANASEVRRLAESQARTHRSRERELISRRQQLKGTVGPHMLMTLELGLRQARTFAQFWEDLVDEQAELAASNGHR